MLDTSLATGPAKKIYGNSGKQERTKEERDQATAWQAGEYRGRNTVPGLKSKKNTRSNQPQTKAQIAQTIIAQAKIDLQNDLEQMSEKEEENFLRYMEENLYSIQDAYIQEGRRRGMLGSALKSYKTFKAARASWFIFWTAIAFSVPQLNFWIFSLIGIGTESIPFANWVLPGETLFMLSHTVIIAIGITTMIYALLVYSLSLVNCFGGSKFLWFALCVAFYCTPILNGPPWFVLWLWVVTNNQGRGEVKE
jgi:hypothetical protein